MLDLKKVVRQNDLETNFPFFLEGFQPKSYGPLWSSFNNEDHEMCSNLP